MEAPVIIVGGGPVGLALALGLARYGARSMVLERNAEPVKESRAAVIWPRTQEILRDWGAYAPLREAGRFTPLLKGVNARTQATFVTVDFSAIEDIFDDPGALMLPQNHTERILRELVNEKPECELRTGVTVTGLSQSPSGVEVFFESSNGPGSLHAAFVVGCDGAHGVVRSAIGLTLQGMTYDARVVLSDETVDADIPPEVTARMRFDQPGLRGAIRFGDRSWRVMASVPKELSDEDALSSIAHRERVRDLFGDAPFETQWSSLFKIHRRHARRFVVGRVILAGDAAHLNSPAGGQGMNAGIQDAGNLAWKLAFAVRSERCAEPLLASYDPERREIITDTVERITDRITRLGITFPMRVRQFALRTFARAIRGRGMQRKLCRGIGMLNGRYSSSPIIDNRHPLAGRRIDDLRLADGSRINLRRAGEAILIVAGDFALDLPHVRVEAPPKRWHVKPPVVLIVRPDGCVASVVEKPTRARVESAWRRAFCDAVPLPVLA
ncbi:MAG TPA: FAD-dependent monooxygenase [Alphaproteobacteria bacterium]|nr:FAD-dependent monooxygenase [Alphaproteobacteria bacterium]